jgi:hypothetical protein
MNGILCVGVLAPHVWLGFHVMAYISPLAPPIIFIEHTNGIRSRKVIRTLMRLGSNILSALIRIVMVVFCAHHK